MISHANKNEFDVFKDSSLRYLGYSNEIGEALRNVVSKKVVYASYFVEIVYFFADVSHKIYLSWIHPDNKEKNQTMSRIFNNSAHTIAWQFFASVTIPPFLVNRIVKLAKVIAMRRTSDLKKVKWIATGCGLMTMPIMPYLIDPVVDDFLDKVIPKNNKNMLI
jgi:fission process protein 1